MTTANKITVFRILLIPFFITQMLYYMANGEEWHRLLALVSFALAAISDGVDGYIARKYDQKSELGAVLDPLADKLLLVSAIIVLALDRSAHFPPVPLWFPAVILSRDILLLIGLAVIHYMAGRVKIRPHFTGKTATVLQMAVVVWALLQWNRSVLDWLMLFAALFTAVSGLIYILSGMHFLGASPSSSAGQKDSNG